MRQEQIMKINNNKKENNMKDQKERPKELGIRKLRNTKVMGIQGIERKGNPGTVGKAD